MRTYLMFKEKAARWNADKEIQAIVKEIAAGNGQLPSTQKYSKKAATALLEHPFDKDAILKKKLPYERLDQLTIDILLGAR
jgi:xylose isomerase